MAKDMLYFCDLLEEEVCYSKDIIISAMKDEGLKETTVRKAEREIGTDYYYCKAYNNFGMRGKDYEPCGKECDEYEPRNGKSGCCKYRGYCYEPGKRMTLTIDGILKPIKQ